MIKDVMKIIYLYEKSEKDLIFLNTIRHNLHIIKGSRHIVYWCLSPKLCCT